MSAVRLKVPGTETLGHPEGLRMTKAQADKLARDTLPADLAKAGFKGYAVETERGFRLCHGK